MEGLALPSLKEKTMAREDWLNGWPRMGETAVLMGTCVQCVGCGKYHGITTVAFDEHTKFPDREPAWPFEEAACPVCALQARVWAQAPEDKLTARLKALREQKQG
jgi:hypothetical protein